MHHILRKQILNQILEVRSNYSGHLKDVEIAYLRFPIPESSEPATILLEIDGQTLCGSVQGAKREILQPLLPDPLRSWQVKILANQLVLAEARRDYDLLHGCAVETTEGAILLIGGSGTGKSTLALELERHGYPLLCEGQIPISRGPAHVKPFPRGFEVYRDKPGGSLTAGFRSEKKAVLPAPGRHSQKDCPLHSVFFLQGLFPGISRQKIELGCPQGEKESFVEFLAEQGAHDIYSETHDQRTLIGCQFDPGEGKGLDELSGDLREKNLKPYFLSFAAVNPPDWGQPLVVSRINSAIAALGMAANALQASRRIPGHDSDSGRLQRFSRYAGHVQAYLLVNGSLSERIRLIMGHFPAKGITKC